MQLFEIHCGIALKPNTYWIAFYQDGFAQKKEDVIFVDKDGAKEFCKQLPSFISHKLLKDAELNMEIWGASK